jgi:hypothetical protein
VGPSRTSALTLLIGVLVALVLFIAWAWWYYRPTLEYYLTVPYDPFGRPPKCADVQRSVLWTLQRGEHTYTCELKFWEEGGTEAQILRDGDLPISRRFEEGWQTLQWAEEGRKYFEKGGE